MVAALCAWHEHHVRAARAIERRLNSGETLIAAAPALFETYAVLTRLPAPHRLSPQDSRALLEANFPVDTVETVALTPAAYRRLLREAPDRGIVGGGSYDAVILACAEEGVVDAILTFNERHFRAIAGQGVSIVVPA